jgi:hypothetical protein
MERGASAMSIETPPKADGRLCMANNFAMHEKFRPTINTFCLTHLALYPSLYASSHRMIKSYEEYI